MFDILVGEGVFISRVREGWREEAVGEGLEKGLSVLEILHYQKATRRWISPLIRPNHEFFWNSLNVAINVRINVVNKDLPFLVFHLTRSLNYLTFFGNTVKVEPLLCPLINETWTLKCKKLWLNFIIDKNLTYIINHKAYVNLNRIRLH